MSIYRDGDIFKFVDPGFSKDRPDGKDRTIAISLWVKCTVFQNIVGVPIQDISSA